MSLVAGDDKRCNEPRTCDRQEPSWASGLDFCGVFDALEECCGLTWVEFKTCSEFDKVYREVVLLLDDAEELRQLLELGSTDFKEFEAFSLFLWLRESAAPSTLEVSEDGNIGKGRSGH